MDIKDIVSIKIWTGDEPCSITYVDEHGHPIAAPCRCAIKDLLSQGHTSRCNCAEAIKARSVSR